MTPPHDPNPDTAQGFADSPGLEAPDDLIERLGVELDAGDIVAEGRPVHILQAARGIGRRALKAGTRADIGFWVAHPGGPKVLQAMESALETAPGALDVTCGIEHEDGYRWSDLTDLNGAVDGRLLAAGLPRDECPVLAGDVSGARVPEAVHRAVLAAITEVADVVVVDGPGPGGPDADASTVLVAGVSPRRVADADRVVLGWPADGRLPVLVTRGPRRDEDLAEVVAAHLGLPLAAHLPDVPRFPVDEAAGRWPGTAGPLTRVADRVLDAVVEPGHRAVAS